MRTDRGRTTWPRRLLRVTLAVLAAVLVTAGGYAGVVAERHERPVALPAPTGHYHVGRAMFEWTDRHRADPLAPRPGMPRQLSVWLWYPAPPDAQGRPVPYAPGAWGQLHFGGPATIAETDFDLVRPHALDGVPVAAGRFPVVVLEPGLGFSAPQYTTIAENLAGHGYLVAGVTPTYSANLTVLHGHTVRATPAGDPGESDITAVGDRLVGVWSADARFAAAQVAGLDATGPFAGHVDRAHTAYVGHSLGGAASLEACRTDPRCAAAADLDGAQYGPVTRTGVGRPVLVMGSENSCVTGTCRPATAADAADRAVARTLLTAGSAPAWAYQIDGTAHFNYSDYGAYYLAAPVRGLLALGPIDGSLALTITNAYLTAFLDHTLRATPQPLLTGALHPFPQVRAERVPR
ncbi:alpha/beta hydrolase family protein [Streptantibioticus cattleyicolor]|uniref:Platelet-activating factor acetylhydrolase n=1 Tax=Streptantibioticus cattleyicolor (strain ATCC 35852 / DSM 46488 / JCM 4925 / NBRC 14057 / NRRL 8057) TaxID=1003195 RepID=F8JL13_STREN|nr:hypothetical protein [Streptantibioticus cattleyicolor]AEW98408.1 hypothetical protein SCATT_p02150 [Streptantibioticus cattleyicolor NRRL 8057 = DSM 46488]CCB72533.1 conserved exported protein of unknown function [Streptantibioticus cattleyicolor NRRL 8057 = DSM 46488]